MTHLQTSCHEDFEDRVIHQQLYWTIEESGNCKTPGFAHVKEYLIRFETAAARKRFVKEYSNRIMGPNTIASQMSRWSGVPYVRVLKTPDPRTLAKENIIFPDISSLSYWKPDLYDQLKELYRWFGVDPRSSSVVSKAKIAQKLAKG